jgi:uncharacterized radical SAM protein YgiQ
MFIPTTRKELLELGWDAPDVILVTGDTYIDSPYIGVAVIGRYLMKHGFSVGIIAQPSLESDKDIARLGEPRLFWGVTAGCVDSMVANYTASRKFRRQDDFTPGGINRRPNRATIAYTNLIRRFFKATRPVVLGGIEAGLRRIAHYDSFDNTVRRSLLLDSKADILVYGMAEKTVVALAETLRERANWRVIPGLCYMDTVKPVGWRELPSFEDVSKDKQVFMKMACVFNRVALDTKHGFVQKHGDRFLVHNPAPEPLTQAELDGIYEMDFEHDAHPFYRTGKIRALDTIRQSITSHRGCFGQCHFCAIAIHQGRRIVSRSRESIEREVVSLSCRPGFNGIIYDIGGPTANMYGVSCRKHWACVDKHCLFPTTCSNLVLGHREQIELLNRLRKLPKIRKIFVSSGIRHDLVVADSQWGQRYVEQLVRYHVSGQIKLAPEHSEQQVLDLMNKPAIGCLSRFIRMFENACSKEKKRYFITYYLMAAHPGCTPQHMRRLNAFVVNTLKHIPRQVQIFTPTPATLSTAMYYCGTDTRGRDIYCERSTESMSRQKSIIKRQ